MNKYLLIHDTTKGADYIRTYLVEGGNGVTIMYSDDIHFKNIYDNLGSNPNYGTLIWFDDKGNALYIGVRKNVIFFKCIAEDAGQVVITYSNLVFELATRVTELEVLLK